MSLTRLAYRPLARAAGTTDLSVALRMADVFVSVQGEGRFSGTRSLFLRTTGCNLRCTFCDTPYTSWTPGGNWMSLDDVISEAERADCEHVVITGGEPLLQPAVVPLTWELRERGHVITIETAGTIDRPVFADLMSISPKRSNSDPAAGNRWRERHQSRQHAPEVIERFLSDYDCQLKFVIDLPSDLDDLRTYLQQFPQISPDQVWLMPQGIDTEALRSKKTWLEPAAHAAGYHFCPRLHIELFGNQRGT